MAFTLFANATAATGAQLDSNYGALSAVVSNPCTIVGTNDLTLTPSSNLPAVTAYANGNQYNGKAPNSNGSAVRVQINALALLNVYKLASAGPVALSGGEIAAGGFPEFLFDSSLNSGAGGFILLNPISAGLTIVSAPSYHKHLVATASTDTTCAITCDAVTVSDQVSLFATLFNVSVTISSAANGANGLDTGALAASTGYYTYIIYNTATATVASLMSLSSTAPTLPSGYTLFARVGWVVTDASKHFLRTIQKGRRGQYTAAYALLISGSTASVATSVSLTNIVPATAGAFYGVLSGGVNSTAVGPNATLSVALIASAAATNSVLITVVLETLAVFYTSNSAAGLLTAQGWEDNL